MAPPMWCGPTTITSIERPLEDYFSRFHTVAMENFKLPDDEIIDGGQGALDRAADAGQSGVNRRHCFGRLPMTSKSASCR